MIYLKKFLLFLLILVALWATLTVIVFLLGGGANSTPKEIIKIKILLVICIVLGLVLAGFSAYFLYLGHLSWSLYFSLALIASMILIFALLFVLFPARG